MGEMDLVVIALTICLCLYKTNGALTVCRQGMVIAEI